MHPEEWGGRGLKLPHKRKGGKGRTGGKDGREGREGRTQGGRDRQNTCGKILVIVETGCGVYRVPCTVFSTSVYV